MPSICFVHKDLSTIDRGGVCNLLKTVAGGLVEEGWDVFAVTTQDLTMDGVTVIKVPAVLDYEAHFERVSQIIKSLNPDIAECSNWRYELIGFARDKGGCKSKIVLRCDPPATSLFKNVEKLSVLERELYLLSDARIAVSNFAKDELLLKYGLRDITVVYNGIKEFPIDDLEKISELTTVEYVNMESKNGRIHKDVPINDLINNNKINVVWIGKPTLMKGFDYLERIVELGFNECNFVINTGYSGIECDWSLENYKKAVFIRGMRKEEQLALLRRMDVGISTSRGEGFGLVVSEELSVGLPVVLNSECKVFNEFVPNEAVTLSNSSNANEFLYSVLHNNGKSNFSRNPSIFTQKELVSGSIAVYQKILNM